MIGAGNVTERELRELRRKISLQRQYINRLRVRAEQVSQDLLAKGWKESSAEEYADAELGAEPANGDPSTPSPSALSPTLLEEQLLIYADELRQLFERSERLRQRSNQTATEAARVVLTLLFVAAPPLFSHGTRVARLSEAIARELGWDDNRRMTLRLASLFHDIGKLFVPTPSDRAADRHPELGGHLLGKIATLRPVATIVRRHHERPDGKGFPEGLSGDTIPLDAQVVAIASTIDHVVEARDLNDHLIAAITALLAGQPGAFAPSAVEVVPTVLRSLVQARQASSRRRKS